MEISKIQIEDIILSHGTRGMDRLRGAVPVGYCDRAANLILKNKGRVLIGTGFPVGGSFETDGPIGAIALYRVLDRLGHEPIFGCAPPISKVLAGDFRTLDIPILSWEASVPVVESALADIQPSVIVSIERPGVAKDSRCSTYAAKTSATSWPSSTCFSISATARPSGSATAAMKSGWATSSRSGQLPIVPVGDTLR